MKNAKFRGFTKSGDWVYWFFTVGMDSVIFADRHDVTPKRTKTGGYTVLARDQVDIRTIGQFTGMKDHCDTEIYEGDLIEFTYCFHVGAECNKPLIGTIVYTEEYMTFQLRGVKNGGWDSFTGYKSNKELLIPFSELDIRSSDFTVIGNVHENPEILK